MRRVSRNVRAARIASAPKSGEPDRESAQAAGDLASGTARHETRHQHADHAHRHDHDDACGHEPEQEGDRAARIQPRHTRQREHGSANRKGGAAGEGDHAVVADEHTRRHETVHRQQDGHDREPAADHDRSRVTAAVAPTDISRKARTAAARALTPTP